MVRSITPSTLASLVASVPIARGPLSVSTHVSFDPAALARVDHQAALRKGDTRQSAGRHPDSRPVVNGERSKIHVSGSDPGSYVGRRGRESHHVLGYQLRGLARIRSGNAASVRSLAWGPITSPCPPDESTGLSTSWSRFDRTNLSWSGSSRE